MKKRTYRKGDFHYVRVSDLRVGDCLRHISPVEGEYYCAKLVGITVDVLGDYVLDYEPPLGISTQSTADKLVFISRTGKVTCQIYAGATELLLTMEG